MTKNIHGLTNIEVIKSREKHGANTLEKTKSKGFFRQFLANLNDPIIKILIIALCVEIIFTFGHCNLFEVFGIVIAIIIATTVSTASEYGSERAFKKMQEENSEARVRVMRDGVLTEISATEIVVGDILYVSTGEKLHADCEIISGRLSVDQSALNGESQEVTKSSGRGEGDWTLSSHNKIFAGSVVTCGDAIARVGRVGAATYYGMVAKDVQTETRKSPLKLRLARLAAQISKIGYFMAFIVAFVYIFNAIVVKNNFDGTAILTSIKDFKSTFAILIHALTLMITVIVVAVPEGLPMMITVVLSANMKKMFADNVLVKKLVGIETAGSMNILFTDKTGTLTVGEPRVERIEAIDATYKSISALKKAEEIYRVLLVSSFYNTDVRFSDGKAVGGNGTDRALAEYFKRDTCPTVRTAGREPFSSERKYSSVTLDNGTVYIKGAPEIIIAKSNYALGSDGIVRKLNSAQIEERLYDATSRGNRVIAVAYRDESSDNFVFAALVVLKDMLRRDSRDAIRGIKRAGVQIVMLTGDSKDTATAIAEECGIVTSRDNDIILTSDELSKMSDAEVKEIIPRLRVLARALPQDKTRLVRLSQELNLVVGMTGDGINDAPSLKLADVGFAMGNGSDIAKDAGDVVILNNSIFSINRTILYGRTIFKSIRKFIVFQLIMNLAACGVSVLGRLVGIESPITIIQMLWVNIIMDTLGGLAFSGEPALEYYMKEKPKRRDEPLLTRSMLARIFILGAYTLSICMIFLKAEPIRAFLGIRTDAEFLTAFYALFIFSGIFNCFTARSERMWLFSSIGKNKPFVIIMLLISVIQILMIFFGGELFRTVPISFAMIGKTALIAATVLPFDFILRVFKKLSKKTDV
ncbi:MAG: calcium-translocating P-type ATPase, PMCA-type [Clostridia bacterium]|nr:calcium-translocating P-type ATPase, PMCA-type [Clostridia bacterium]